MWVLFPVAYTLAAMLPDQFCILNIKNVLSAYLLVLPISFIAELFLHDVNLPLLTYVWGRKFLSVIQQQWADKEGDTMWYHYGLFWGLVDFELLQEFFNCHWLKYCFKQIKKTKQPTTKAKHGPSVFLYAGIFALEVIKNVTVVLHGIPTQLYFFTECVRVQLVEQKHNKH